MNLFLSSDLERQLEEAHILQSDIAAAIVRAEAEGYKLINQMTGRFTTSYRPGHVTFWVEYAPEGDGYRVHNTYCHRMSAVLAEDPE